MLRMSDTEEDIHWDKKQLIALKTVGNALEGENQIHIFSRYFPPRSITAPAQIEIQNTILLWKIFPPGSVVRIGR